MPEGGNIDDKTSEQRWADIWTSTESLLNASNLHFDESSKTVKGQGISAPIDIKIKDQLELSLIKLINEVEEIIKYDEDLNKSKELPNTDDTDNLEESASVSKDTSFKVINETSSNSKDIIVDDPSDTKRTIIKIGSDKIKIKLERKPELSDNTGASGSSVNDAIEDINKNKRDFTPDEEEITGVRKKAKIKFENDEDEEEENESSYKEKENRNKEEDNDQIDVYNPEDEYLGEAGDIPSVYKSLPAPNFNMKELVDSIVKVLELYDEERNKTSAKDFDEYWRRKCAVAHYPTTDLKNELPGEIPMTDFSGPKPGNQISFTTFMGYIEGFFRNFNEDDLRWLGQKTIHSAQLFSAINPPPLASDGSKIINGGAQPYDPNKDPQFIPPLGPNYQDVWQAENEGKQIRLSKLQAANGLKIRKQLATPLGDSKSIQSNCDEFDTKVSAGPLTSRLLSAIVPDEMLITKEYFNKEDDLDELNNPGGMNFEQIEERLKRELNYVGVFMNVRQKLSQESWDQDWGIYKEDDEISSEIRKLQKELKATQARNNVRKSVLMPRVKEQIAWQEYMMIVEDLDKQVEQHYRRRISVVPKKSTKKKVNDEKEDNTHMITNASFKGLLDKRRRWIEKIGPLFKTNIEMRRMPDESIFKSALEQLEKSKNDNDNDDDGDGEGEGEGEGENEHQSGDEVNTDQL